jgi:dolichol-phosphate mannosyltransferase
MIKYICLSGKKKKTLTKPEKPFNLKKEVSIILPTYNEEKNIAPLVYELKKQFSQIKYEVVILDDNSSDKTPQIIDNLAKKANVLAIHRYGKKGYFSAYQDAISMSNGEYFIMMDADFSHSPKLAKTLYEKRKLANIISASRYMPQGKMKAPFLRKYGSMFLNHLGIFIIGLKQTDATNEFIIMKKADFKKIKFKYQPVFGEFYFELLYRAKKIGMKVKEIPCKYVYRTEGDSAMGTSLSDARNLMNFSLNYIKMALKIRFHG